MFVSVVIVYSTCHLGCSAELSTKKCQVIALGTENSGIEPIYNGEKKYYRPSSALISLIQFSIYDGTGDPDAVGIARFDIDFASGP